MKFLSVAEMAEKWGVSERSVRKYCAEGRVAGAELCGKNWRIPADAAKPQRRNLKKSGSSLLSVLQRERKVKMNGGIYHKVQMDLTYNSNHIEGSRLTHDQTRFIFETNTIGVLADTTVSVDDIIESANHFRCIDLVIDSAASPLTERFIKQLHGVLKSGTQDSFQDWFAVGDYKKVPNEVGGMATTAPEEVEDAMRKLLERYHPRTKKTLEEIVAFHVAFEHIHPFQDGNGRVGRLLLFRECLRNDIVPFIISEDLKFFYYRGLREWDRERGYLLDTCRTAQDRFRGYLQYFRIPVEK